MGKLSKSVLGFYSRDLLLKRRSLKTHLSYSSMNFITTHPLFLRHCLFYREAKKAELANTIWNKVEGSGQTYPEGECKYIVDGCALPWKSGQTYGAAINSYVSSMLRTSLEKLQLSLMAMLPNHLLKMLPIFVDQLGVNGQWSTSH